jgi:hypothetical protein
VPRLLLGPLLRYVSHTEATVWVEASERCTVSVLGCERRTFCVDGHHYALVHVTGLEPGTITPYEVHLDDERVWPLPDAEHPPSVIKTHAHGDDVRIVFGSCRVAYPHEKPWILRKDEHKQGREVDALRALVLRMGDHEPRDWPDALLMLGDQIYADEVAPGTREFIRRRRDTSKPPGEQLADFEEYTHLYRESWNDPPIRWLLSTVPSAMIFDDHDVLDDWNTSQAWLEEMREEPWWNERIIGAFMAYWIHQHIGNLTPQSLEADELYQRVCEADDAAEMLREFAYHADRTVDSTQWSFCRDIGPARLIMVDSRAGRVLEPGRRSMVDDREWGFIERHAREVDCEHLLIGTSLPWLLAEGMHHVEAWNEAVCDGAWGPKWSKLGEQLRQGLDLEHWAAFRGSFERLGDLLREIGAGQHGTAPKTIVALSGDVHHAYLAEVGFPRGSGVRSRVYQAVCSPFRNPLDANERRVIRFGASRFMARAGRLLARSAGVPAPRVAWRFTEEPYFDNVVGSLTLGPDSAHLVIERVREREGGTGMDLERVLSHDL